METAFKLDYYEIIMQNIIEFSVFKPVRMSFFGLVST